MLDEDGQPFNRRYGEKRLNDRAIDELIGLSKGIIADQRVNQKEAEFLRSWMEANVSFCEDRNVNLLYCRIHEMLIDGVLDAEEQRELLDILRCFSGQSIEESAVPTSSTLPFCDPPPRVEFPTMNFCLTGKFAYGPRRICQEVIIERGGNILDRVSHDLDYLVVGFFASRDWAHSSYGRKIERAMEIREQTGDLSIISEDHWANTAFRM